MSDSEHVGFDPELDVSYGNTPYDLHNNDPNYMAAVGLLIDRAWPTAERLAATGELSVEPLVHPDEVRWHPNVRNGIGPRAFSRTLYNPHTGASAQATYVSYPNHPDGPIHRFEVVEQASPAAPDRTSPSSQRDLRWISVDANTGQLRHQRGLPGALDLRTWLGEIGPGPLRIDAALAAQLASGRDQTDPRVIRFLQDRPSGTLVGRAEVATALAVADARIDSQERRLRRSATAAALAVSSILALAAVESHPAADQSRHDQQIQIQPFLRFYLDTPGNGRSNQPRQAMEDQATQAQCPEVFDMTPDGVCQVYNDDISYYQDSPNIASDDEQAANPKSKPYDYGYPNFVNPSSNSSELSTTPGGVPLNQPTNQG